MSNTYTEVQVSSYQPTQLLRNVRTQFLEYSALSAYASAMGCAVVGHSTQPRNQRQNSTRPVQFVLRKWFSAFDFAVRRLPRSASFSWTSTASSSNSAAEGPITPRP
eukprot:798059-Rhodomonas_salina.1